MKKFYIPIFTAALLLASFWSLGQTFNSIAPNTGPYSYDDGRFWQGGIPPPNPCVGCTININSDVAMAQAASGSTSASKSVFSSQTPSGGLYHGLPLTLGMRFQSSTAGYISQASFYKVAGMTGPHTGILYDAVGTVLATILFTGETASGWQFQSFAAPVAIAANTTYIIAVFYADGNYTAANNYFSASFSNGPLTAPQDIFPNSNGLFNYAGAPTFPTLSYFSTNYWVDVSFSVTGAAPYTNVFGPGSTAPPPTLGLFTGPALTLGMKFQSAVAGNVLGAKFYKIPGMNGPHTGVLYDNTGTQLASVLFTGETASGWQSQNFAAPVPIAANTTYTIAIFYADGNYTSTYYFFGSAYTNGSLTALADGGVPSPNGAYIIGPAPAFPTAGYVQSNYWVDLSFNTPVDPSLNDMVFNNSTIKVNGNTTLTVNTYVQLQNGSFLVLAPGTANHAVLNLNDQMDLSDAASNVQIGNSNSYINTNNLGGNPIVGPHDDFLNPGFPIAGIYSILGAPVGGYNYSYTLTGEAIGFNLGNPKQQPNYGYLPLNCGGAGGCGFGFVSGPALTGNDPAGNLGIIFNSSTTLPVQLAQFLASKKDDGSVLLTWATSQETNAGYYEVERSGDQSGWLALGSVKAKGNSSTTTNYSFSDGLPLDGTGYYRLKMVDLDGKFQYSQTISVSNTGDRRPLVIYSNPFSDMIRLKVNVARAQDLTMTVSDVLGKTYVRQVYHAASGDNLVNLPSSITSQGMYILRIHGESYDQTVKLEKQ